VEELYGLVHLFDRNWDVIDEKNEYILQKEYAQGVSTLKLLVCLMVFNATFNNISVILWQSVLLVKETGVPGENHKPVASH
jgi:hypothetical protein